MKRITKLLLAGLLLCALSVTMFIPATHAATQWHDTSYNGRVFERGGWSAGATTNVNADDGVTYEVHFEYISSAGYWHYFDVQIRIYWRGDDIYSTTTPTLPSKLKYEIDISFWFKSWNVLTRQYDYTPIACYITNWHGLLWNGDADDICATEEYGVRTSVDTDTGDITYNISSLFVWSTSGSNIWFGRMQSMLYAQCAAWTYPTPHAETKYVMQIDYNIGKYYGDYTLPP